MEYLNQQLTSALNQLGLKLSEQQIAQLLLFNDALYRWNQFVNFTSLKTAEAMLSRHIIDSLTISPYLTGQRFVDIGTGPGLPGIPLAIVNPNIQAVLVEPREKRTSFMRQMVYDLGLSNVEVVQSRVENFHPANLFDVVLSRAFAALPVYIETTHRLLNQDGIMLAMLGEVHDSMFDALPENLVCSTLDTVHLPDNDKTYHIAVLKRPTST